MLLRENWHLVAIAAIIALGIFNNIAYFYGPSWINGSDNYIYFSQAGLLAHGQIKQVGCMIVDCTNYLIFAGVAFFFLLFGEGLLSAALFGIFCFSATIVIIYIIGRELHGKAAGVIAGLFYSVMPLVLSQSSNVGDDIPMMMLVSFGVMLAVLALKRKEDMNRYLLMSGFVIAINLLSVSEAAIGILFLSAYLLSLVIYKRRRRFSIGFCFYAIGIGAALAVIMVIGLYEGGSPSFVMSVYSQNYNTYFSGVQPAMTSYIKDLFLNWKTGPTLGNLAFGYFGYATVAAGAYLAAIRFRKGTILAYWLLIPLFYLGFGSMSFEKYIPVLYIGPRYALMFVPPIALLVGIALAEAIRMAGRMKAPKKMAIRIASAAIGFLLVISAIANARYIDYSQLSATEPLMQIGSYVNSLHAGAKVYIPYAVPLSYYVDSMHVLEMAQGYPFGSIGCETINSMDLSNGSFIVGNVTGYKSCSLSLVYSPVMENWLRNYTLFSNWGDNFYGYNVYEYATGKNNT